MAFMKFVLVVEIGCMPSLIGAARVAEEPSNFEEHGIGRDQSKTKSTYSESDALLNLQYARAAYCTKALVSSWDCGDPCSKAPAQEVRFIEDRSWQIQGYVAKLPSTLSGDEGRCLISFRGMAEFWNNLLAVRLWMSAWPNWKGADKSLCPGCRVYTGNAVAYARLREQMWQAVNSLECKSLSFSGHSMGGALVTLASMEARRLGYVVPSVYTFGKPAIGNAKFRQTYVEAAASQNVEPPQWRLVHYYDEVPRMRMCMGDTCVQEPQEIYYTARNGTSYKECTETPDEDPTCSAAVSAKVAGQNGGGPDHEWYLGTDVGTDAYIAECKAREAKEQ
eukprot:TRINITY_DN5554_c0_g1_i1.p1 TRINITY_DN5554_c0_g1~~TRINITY_DN5554_c0_g1_i1.p1  ORF type:complete len:335 (-),score=49.22 TRINITY_DN5554_c0_g1_i1:43-1047(-)